MKTLRYTIIKDGKRVTLPFLTRKKAVEYITERNLENVTIFVHQLNSTQGIHTAV